MNHKWVERIWRDEGLQVPKKQPKRRRLWFDDGSRIRLRQHDNTIRPHSAGLLEGKNLTSKLASFMGAGQSSSHATVMPETTRRCRFEAPKSSIRILVSVWLAKAAGKTNVCISSRTWLVARIPWPLPA